MSPFEKFLKDIKFVQNMYACGATYKDISAVTGLDEKTVKPFMTKEVLADHQRNKALYATGFYDEWENTRLRILKLLNARTEATA